MARGSGYGPPADPLISEIRILLPRLDRIGAAARRYRPAAVACAGVHPRLGCGDSLLLRELLLAHLLDDPLRRRPRDCRLRVTAAPYHHRRVLSRVGNDADCAGDQTLGRCDGLTRSGVLDGMRMVATRSHGPTLE